MKKSTATIVFGFVAIALLLQAPSAQAQRSVNAWKGSSAQPEISVMYGSMWGGHIDTRLGKFRIDTGESWSIAASLPLPTGMWGEFSYARQGTQINLDTRTNLTNLTDMTVHYWQLGTLKGLPTGNFMPYFLASLGMTYYSPEANRVEVNSITYRVDSTTKFSMAFGVGVKAVLGPDQRIGLRAQIRVLPTLYNSDAGLWIGTGGGGVAISGSAIWQYEVSAGVVVKLGK